jgi:hypothetical protein
VDGGRAGGLNIEGRRSRRRHRIGCGWTAGRASRVNMEGIEAGGGPGGAGVVECLIKGSHSASFY